MFPMKKWREMKERRETQHRLKNKTMIRRDQVGRRQTT
jgi:hypothetical protein